VTAYSARVRPCSFMNTRLSLDTCALLKAASITLTPPPLRLQLQLQSRRARGATHFQTESVPFPRHTTFLRPNLPARRINAHPIQHSPLRPDNRRVQETPCRTYVPSLTARIRAMPTVSLTSASRLNEPSSSSPSSASCKPSPNHLPNSPERTTDNFPAMTQPKSRASLCAGGTSASTC